jgi:hypothetical protein
VSSVHPNQTSIQKSIILTTNFSSAGSFKSLHSSKCRIISNHSEAPSSILISQYLLDNPIPEYFAHNQSLFQNVEENVCFVVAISMLAFQQHRQLSREKDSRPMGDRNSQTAQHSHTSIISISSHTFSSGNSPNAVRKMDRLGMIPEFGGWTAEVGFQRLIEFHMLRRVTRHEIRSGTCAKSPIP